MIDYSNPEASERRQSALVQDGMLAPDDHRLVEARKMGKAVYPFIGEVEVELLRACDLRWETITASLLLRLVELEELVEALRGRVVAAEFVGRWEPDTVVWECCGQERGHGCTVFGFNRDDPRTTVIGPRVAHGAEGVRTARGVTYQPTEPCRLCDTPVGFPHHIGCPMESCAMCGRRREVCSCSNMSFGPLQGSEASTVRILR